MSLPHVVRILPRDRELTVAPGETILAAALRQGLRLPYACRTGACCACQGELIAGEVEYPEGRPPALGDAAAGRVILCQARPTADCEIEAREIEADDEIAVCKLPARVAARESLAHDVVRLRLRPPAAERLPFLPGQYIDLLLRDGRRRSFSLANSPEDALLELHVRVVPGGRFSERLLPQVAEKTVLRIEGPIGAFYLREDSMRPLILMAGGTGFAPIKSMVEHALVRGLDRPMHVFWGVRARRDLYLGELAAGWARDHAQIAFTPVLSEPAPADDWTGATGWVHEAVLAAYPDLSDHEVYMAGPPGMIAAARPAFAAAGLPRAALYFDAFEYAADRDENAGNG